MAGYNSLKILWSRIQQLHMPTYIQRLPKNTQLQRYLRALL